MYEIRIYDSNNKIKQVISPLEALSAFNKSFSDSQETFKKQRRTALKEFICIECKTIFSVHNWHALGCSLKCRQKIQQRQNKALFEGRRVYQYGEKKGRKIRKRKTPDNRKSIFQEIKEVLIKSYSPLTVNEIKAGLLLIRGMGKKISISSTIKAKRSLKLRADLSVAQVMGERYQYIEDHDQKVTKRVGNLVHVNF